MRSIRMLLLGLVAVALLAPAAFANHFTANCPLSYVSGTPSTSPFFISPHGVFQNGSVVYLLHGQTLTTLDKTDLGNLSVAREDVVASLGNRDEQGGVAYSNGFMFVAGEAGIEVFDLRNVHGGGSAPVLVSRTDAPHYRRLAVNGNLLVGLYPATDMPCMPHGTSACSNSVDIYSIVNLSAPALVGRIVSDPPYYAFNDIAFLDGWLWTTGTGGTFAFDVSNPFAPGRYYSNSTPGTFLATNGSTVMAVGQENQIAVFTYRLLSGRPMLNYFNVFTLPSIWDKANDIIFHPEAWIDDNRLVTMIDERDPENGQSARTLAFDVFDFSVPALDGSSPRIYENLSYTFPDEVKWDPFVSGPYVYVTGEISGTQKWGVCDQIAGRIEYDGAQKLPCTGAEIHGYVTGKQQITSVQIFLDDVSLGFANLTTERTDIMSPTPVRQWNLPVSLNDVAQGMHTLRAVGTDILGNTRQFNSVNVWFNGPGQNCTTRRRGIR